MTSTAAPPAETKQTPLEFVASQIAAVPNFPKEGILFRDISPLLRNVKAREIMFDLIAENYKAKKIDAVAGLDARGFIFATALATRLQCKLVMIRKKSKLPNTISVDYGLEYGTNTIEIQKDAFEPNDNVLIIDDLLATGGTLIAAIKLVEQVKAKVASLCCLIELEGLGGREAIAKVGNYDTFCLLKLPGKATPPSEQKAVVPAAAPAKPIVPKEFFTLHVKPNDERIVLFYYPPMKSIAESICQKFGDQFRIGNIQWQNFPDGWYNIRFEHMEHLKNRNVVFLGSLRDPTKYLEQISMAMVLPRQLVKSLDLVFPFFGPATMERAEEEGILATAETTAKITTRCMPNTRAGPAVFRVFDIHALPVRFYFEDTVVMNMMSAVPLLTDFIHQTRKSTNTSNVAPITCIAYPDEGAAKRFKLMFKTVPAITCSKVRDGDKRSVKIIDRLNWPVDDSNAMDHVLIIDDMVQSGGTLDECRKALIGLGAKKVSCYVTHAVFPNEGWKKFMKGGEREGFYRFFTTNTIPETASLLEGKEPFHIFHIEELLAQSILTDIGRSKTTPANNPVIRAYVASTAYSKLISAKKAFEAAFPEHLVKIHSVEAPSGIPSQPIGFEQTKLGAQNRLEAIRKNITTESCHWGENDSVFFVSLENGLIKEETAEKTTTTTSTEIWKDYCQVLVELHQGSAFGKSATTAVVEAESDMIELPSPVVMKEVFESNCNVTAGSLLEMKHGWEKDTWHKHVSGVDRSEYMAKAIANALKLLQKQVGSQ